MKSFNLLEELEKYKGFDEHEESIRIKALEFIRSDAKCFERDNYYGHFTGSAWILDRRHDYVLMTHHGKFNLWLQLGGHSDGDPNTLQVALREIEEESGLKNTKLLKEGIFDIDIHMLEPCKDQPAHYHFDVRFIFEADINEPIIISNESKDLKWVKLDEVEKYNNYEEMMRMVRKSKLYYQTNNGK